MDASAAREFERALDLYDQAITLNPLHAEAYYRRGNTLKDLGQLRAAVASYDKAILIKPDYAHAYCNRGVVQQALELRSDALSSYDLAISHDPLDARTHYNRALLLQDCSRWEEALQSYDKAIAADPAFADAQYNRAVALLSCGDFGRGWANYEWRWRIPGRIGLGDVRHFIQPLWLGKESVDGKRVLLHSEGGLGDTLQFCRYASLLAKQGATIYLEVPASLVHILASLEGVTRVIAQGEALPPFDYRCPLLSLPLACKTTLASIPSARKYLYSDEAKVRHWRLQLKDRTRPRVGLVWSGNPNHTNDRHRSVRLADWLPHLPEGFDYFRLQRDVSKDDQATLDLNPSIISIEPSYREFSTTAALCECMDVVISVDTSLAHLSAAVGQRTWILLSFNSDWRWLREREDSPWYPSVKLYRQSSSGGWSEVFERIAADLRSEFRVD